MICTGNIPVTPDGTVTTTCMTPAGAPGTPLALCNSAAFPPMVTFTGSSGRGGDDPAILPSAPLGVVWPSPVANIVRALPTSAGRDGPFEDPSALNARACPVPVASAVKIPGAAAATASGNGCVEPFPACTTTCAVAPPTLYGTI